jgi:uncharacterized damage-inducible protein DinB
MPGAFVDILLDCFGRVRESFHDAVSGLTADDLAWRPDPDANSIGWLAWHLTRVQDDHIAGVAGSEQIWIAQDWKGRFGLPVPDRAIGYGHSSAEVASLRFASDQFLLDYHEATYQATVAFLNSLEEPDLEQVVDDRWDPPVTLAVRLVSVINDDLQHVGQAAYVRGLLGRRSATALPPGGP